VGVHRLKQQPLPFELREQQLLNALRIAVDRYRPAPYAGPTVLYRAAQVDSWFSHVGAKRGWDNWLPELEVVEVPGNHDNFVLDPNVSVMTTHLARTLRVAERGGDARTAAVASLPTATAS
jgi:thioesterase domain-containing protein